MQLPKDVNFAGYVKSYRKCPKSYFPLQTILN